MPLVPPLTSTTVAALLPPDHLDSVGRSDKVNLVGW
jgi:hypothetical protein